MQNKGVKSVFKKCCIGSDVFGCFPVLPSGNAATFQLLRHYIITLYKYDEMLSIRVVVGDMVIEAHVDKYKNLIYREYEKKK